MHKGVQHVVVIAAALLVFLASAHASTFNVNPVQLYLTSDHSSTLLSIHNTSAETMRFDLDAFAWEQQPDGETKLTPTKDVIFFPRILTLEAGQKRKVRVGLSTTAKKTEGRSGTNKLERTYRILVQEMPSKKKRQSAGEIQVLTRMSIPIFVAPDKVVEKTVVAKTNADDGRFSFQVKNDGNVHTMIKELRITALGSNGKQLYSRELKGWYLLAKDVRDYSLPIPADLCSKIAAISVVGKTNHDALSFEYRMPAGACKAR